MSRKSAERKLDATADDYQRDLVKLIRSFSHGHHLYTVFSDFVELCALAISNSVDRLQFEVREKRYLEIVAKYSRDEVERFPQMLGLLTMSFELRVQSSRKASEGGASACSGGLTDVLGQIYMMLELGNARAGQYFTPYSVSHLMALMTVGDGGEEVREGGFMRLQEPACGAGGMVIATAHALADAGRNYQQTMHATCIDIDQCCIHMTFVQLSLLGIPAVVVHGNALTLDVWGLWYTPAHVLVGWRWKLERRQERRMARLSADPDPAPADGYTHDVDIAHVCEEPEGEVATVVERPSLRSAPVASPPTATSLAEMFEESAAATNAVSMFAKIDQLALF
ncbi:N-6 DNA methylase [Paraburkholderia phenazinium]|uniref:N-6 DNA methylase n=1 Tax=Paraburkholderia phenazinium TaxID=60549 RepID=UPI00158D5466|nr:N-6 DNA methylase [Paraburkholderia phenazinium]